MFLNNVPGEHGIKELQKIAMLVTAQMFQKVVCESTKFLSRDITLTVPYIITTE